MLVLPAVTGALWSSLAHHLIPTPPWRNTELVHSRVKPRRLSRHDADRRETDSSNVRDALVLDMATGTV